MPKVSMKTIAENLHLSKATVSWILSGQGEEKGFSEKTISRVKTYAEEIGYTPNLIARSLSKGYTKIIGLIIPTINDQFYSHLAYAIERCLTEKKFMLVLGSSEGDAKKEKELIKMFRSMQVGGLIIAPTNKAHESLEEMNRENFPFVLIDRHDPTLETSYVVVNNEESSAICTRILINKGCRKIAMILAEKHLYVMEKRCLGYKKTVEKYLDTFDPSLVLDIQRKNVEKDLETKLSNLLNEHPDIDGFFFGTHYLAEATIQYFNAKDVDYKKRFKFACMHSTRTLDILVPEMTRAIMPIEEMGETAVNIVLKKMKEPESRTESGIILSNTTYPDGNIFQ